MTRRPAWRIAPVEHAVERACGPEPGARARRVWPVAHPGSGQSWPAGTAWETGQGDHRRVRPGLQWRHLRSATAVSGIRARSVASCEPEARVSAIRFGGDRRIGSPIVLVVIYELLVLDHTHWRKRVHRGIRHAGDQHGLRPCLGATAATSPATPSCRSRAPMAPTSQTVLLVNADLYQIRTAS